MDIVIKLYLLSSTLFLYGSLALINNTDWQIFSAPLFLAGCLFSFVPYCLKKSPNTLPVLLLSSYSSFAIGSFVIIILPDNDHHLSPAILFLIGSLCLLFIKKNDNKIIPNYFPAICFTVGSIFLFPAIINVTIAGILFSVGSIFLIINNTDDFFEEEKIDFFAAILLIGVIELLLILNINIETLYDNRVSERINHVAFFGVLIGIISNFPQIVHTAIKKTTEDFSGLSLALWIISSIAWSVFSILSKKYFLLANHLVSFITVIFLSYYKLWKSPGHNSNTFLFEPLLPRNETSPKETNTAATLRSTFV